MRPSATATRYAQAAFDVAQKDGDIGLWVNNLRSVTASLQEPEVSGFFKDPNVAMSEKMATLEHLAGDVSPHVLNLLRALVSRHRLHLVPLILREFERLHRVAEGLSDALVIVARPLSNGEVADIEQRLGRLTGKQVHVQTEVDPTILGGIVVRIGDRLFDASVAGRLERLRRRIAV